jgi:hypothetical protein
MTILYASTDLNAELVVLFHVKTDDLSAWFSAGGKVSSDSHTLSLLMPRMQYIREVAEQCFYC